MAPTTRPDVISSAPPARSSSIADVSETGTSNQQPSNRPDSPQSWSGNPEPVSSEDLEAWSWDLPADALPARRAGSRRSRLGAAETTRRRFTLRDHPAVMKATAWLVVRRVSLLYVLPLIALTAVVGFINLGGSPQRVDDEGTYTAQAYAVDTFGQLAHYTYWYDHPPLGWIQIALWAKLTGAFERYDLAVLAGREFMVVASAVAAALLWLLARRLRLSRPAAGAAVAIFALSPLAVQYHRTVFLDNVATPWLLAAFVLAFAPRRQLAAFAGAAVCFAVAVLSKETYLLFAPFLAWQMWREAHRETRRYTLSLAAAITVVVGLCYVLYATLKGELLPSSNRVSLASGIIFQLGGRVSSGSLLDANSAARVTFQQWMLDPNLLLIGSLAAVLLLVVRKRRFTPIAAAVVFLDLFALRPGYLPVPYVIGLLPFLALLIPALVEVSLKAAMAASSKVRRRLQIGSTVAIAGLAAVVTAPMWLAQAPGLLAIDQDQPMRQAEDYVMAYVPRDDRVIVDDAIWVDLVRAGFDRDHVVWYYKVDTDKDVQASAPNGWRDYDYIVSTNSMRSVRGDSPQLTQALANSTVIASFGSGDRMVTVQQVHSQGVKKARAQTEQDRQARIAAGRSLAGSDAVQLSAANRRLLTAGGADSRVLLALRMAAKAGTVTVDDLPPVAGEDEVKRPRRQLLISELNGKPLLESKQGRTLVAKLENQTAPAAPEAFPWTESGALLLTYSVETPADLLKGWSGS